MKLKTVNVIELHSGIVEQLSAFPDNKAGNKKAEALFTKLFSKIAPDYDQANVTMFMDGGCFDDGNGREILLVHSS